MACAGTAEALNKTLAELLARLSGGNTPAVSREPRQEPLPGVATLRLAFVVTELERQLNQAHILVEAINRAV